MGLPEFSQNVEVQANPNKRVRSVVATVNTEILAGQSLNVQIYSPDGFISTIQNLQLNWSAFGSSGSKQAILAVASGAVGVLNVVVPYTDALTYIYGAVAGTPTTAIPADDFSQFLAPRVSFDDSNYLNVRFVNNTAASDGGINKTILLWVLEEKVG